YHPTEFHRRCGLIGKGEPESNVQVLNITEGSGTIIKLSPLDMPENFSWSPFIFPFENINNEADFMNDDMLKRSLLETISRIPIVTGHLERIDGTPLEMDGPNSNLHVVVGTKGVWYASSNIPGSFQEFKRTGFSYERLHQNYIFRRGNEAVIEGKDYSLQNIKVSRFECGSVVLFVSTCHLIADARSIYEFVRTWSNLCRNQAGETMVHEARHLFGYDERLGEGAAAIFKGLTSMKKIAPRQPQMTKLVTFEISTHEMAKLKAKLNQELAPEWVSTDDVLCILGWRALMRARQVPQDAPTKLVRVIDVRKFNDPPLPMHAFCNGVSIYTLGPQSVLKTLTSSLASLTKEIRKGMDVITKERIRDSLSAIHQIPYKEHPLAASTIPFSDDAFASSFTKFIPTEINFHNSPCLTLSRGVLTEGLILPHCVYNGSISVKMGINSLHLNTFLNDPELTGLGFKIYA
ncbi:hypothetical protein L0F63_007131, partial [Massospora cicadina]